jgi:hypothetical protein
MTSVTANYLLRIHGMLSDSAFLAARSLVQVAGVALKPLDYRSCAWNTDEIPFPICPATR